MTRLKHTILTITMLTCVVVPIAAGIAGCSQTQLTRAVAAGQLFCGVATGTGGTLTVALADAAGVPIIVTGLASTVVKAACAAIGGIPVTPPPAPASAPLVAAPIASP